MGRSHRRAWSLSGSGRTTGHRVGAISCLPLQVHFDLKERLGLPEAVMTDDTIEFHEPVRLGDLLRTHQVLQSVSGPKETKLGEGRFWVIDVVYRNQRDELVAVETYTGFGYRRDVSRPRVLLCHSSVPSARRASPVAWRDGDGRSREHVEIEAQHRGCSQATSRPESRLPELSYDVTATTVVLGALATRDWRPMHHDKDFAVGAQRDPRHLLEYAESGSLVREVHHRLDRPTRPAREDRFQDEGFGLPRRHDGAARRGGGHDPSCRRGNRLGRSGTRAQPSATSVATSASARVVLAVGPNDNPWLLRAERWNP